MSRILRVTLFISSIACIFASALTACGSVYAVADGADGGAGGGDASTDADLGPSLDGTTTSDGANTDGSSLSDAGSDSAVAPTYCSSMVGALWCDDFDTSSDAATSGSDPVVQLNGTAVLGAVPLHAESSPNSLNVSIASADGGAVYATIAKTLPFPATARVTAKTGIYFAKVPTGYSSAALVVTMGATVLSAGVLPNGSGGIKVAWDCQYGNTSQDVSTDIAVGSYHELSVVVVSGRAAAVVDGVALLTVPLTMPSPSFTVQVGLYNDDPGTEQSEAFFDNILVTAP